MNEPEAFWSRVDSSGGVAACWPWLGPINHQRGGYGAVRWGRRPWRTHRLAWTLTYGPIPDGLHVCHSCDNPPCCNTAHLFIGTNAANLRDMVLKGRSATGSRHKSRTHPERVARGERHFNARLSVDQVMQIRQRIAAGEQHALVASDFGVSRAHVTNIISGVRWGHLLWKETYK